jgi:hypothetical protein
MENHPTTTVRGPWRILVLDPDPADPKWIVATVVELADVRPAGPGAVLDEVTAAWVGARAGLHRPALTRLRHADVWRIDEQPQEN